VRAADPANGRNAGPEGVTHPIRECHPAGGVRWCHHFDGVVGQGVGATTGRLAARRCAEAAGTEPNVSATKRGTGEVNKIWYHRGQTLRAQPGPNAPGPALGPGIPREAVSLARQRCNGRDAGAAGRTEIEQPKGRPLGLFWLVARWCLDSAIRDSRFAAATLATSGLGLGLKPASRDFLEAHQVFSGTRSRGYRCPGARLDTLGAFSDWIQEASSHEVSQIHHTVWPFGTDLRRLRAPRHSCACRSVTCRNFNAPLPPALGRLSVVAALTTVT